MICQIIGDVDENVGCAFWILARDAMLMAASTHLFSIVMEGPSILNEQVHDEQDPGSLPLLKRSSVGDHENLRHSSSAFA